MSTAVQSSELASQAVWRIDRIKDNVLKIGSGVTPTGGAASYLDTGVPLLRSQNVHFDGLRLDDVAYIAEETHEEMSGTKLRPRDVLLNITGASIGRCTFVPDNFGEGNVNQHVCIIRPTERLDHKFLNYCLCAPWGQDQVFASFTGASRQGLGQRDLGAIQVPLPPLPEQHRIATYLDASCAAIDAAVAAKGKQLATLSQFRKAIITEAVTSGIVHSVEKRSSGIEWIGEIPRHWKVEKLKYLTSMIVDGTHVTPTYVPDGVPFLRVTDIQDESIDLSEVKRILPEEHELLSKRARARRGDILLSKNGTIGIVKVVDWDWEFSFFVSLCLLRPERRLNPLYFTFFFESSIVEQQLFESSKKTSVTNLHLVKIRELLICVPPPNEQREIVRYLQSRCLDLRTVASNIESQIATLTNYRKSLIHECVTGQRRITESDLNRVKAHG
jgi:type I restriction enzyme S subunit